MIIKKHMTNLLAGEVYMLKTLISFLLRWLKKPSLGLSLGKNVTEFQFVLGTATLLSLSFLPLFLSAHSVPLQCLSQEFSATLLCPNTDLSSTNPALLSPPPSQILSSSLASQILVRY